MTDTCKAAMKLVERTLDALTVLSREPDGMALTELAERLDIPSSSAHRILGCLKKNRFVSQDTATKRYRIGYKVLTLCANISEENSFAAAAKPFMRKLADRIGKTITLCVLEGGSVICIHYIESKDTTMFLVRTGFAMPPHATSAGKAIQAHMPAEEIQQLCRSSADKLTNHTKTGDEMLAELALVRERGYAVSDEELQLGVQGAACPVFDFMGKVLGSVSYTALKSDGALTEENISLLKQCAADISHSIGRT